MLWSIIEDRWLTKQSSYFVDWLENVFLCQEMLWKKFARREKGEFGLSPFSCALSFRFWVLKFGLPRIIRTRNLNFHNREKILTLHFRITLLYVLSIFLCSVQLWVTRCSPLTCVNSVSTEYFFFLLSQTILCSYQWPTWTDPPQGSSKIRHRFDVES